MEKKEEKPTLSYSEEHEMPLLPTTIAVAMAIGLLRGTISKEEAVFEADEKFIDHWKKRNNTDQAPTQQEINDYVSNLVQECKRVSREEARRTVPKKVDIN